MLLVFAAFGCPPGKMTVSPLPGMPANPQLALLFQLALAPKPDQVHTAPWAGRETNRAPMNTMNSQMKRGDRLIFMEMAPVFHWPEIHGSLLRIGGILPGM